MRVVQIGHDQIEEREDVGVLDRQRALHIGLARVQGRVQEQLGAQCGVVKPYRHHRRAGSHRVMGAGVIDDHERAPFHQGPKKAREQHGVSGRRLNCTLSQWVNPSGHCFNLVNLLPALLALSTSQNAGWAMGIQFEQITLSAHRSLSFIVDDVSRMRRESAFTPPADVEAWLNVLQNWQAPLLSSPGGRLGIEQWLEAVAADESLPEPL